VIPKPYDHMKMKTPLPKLIIAAICIAATLHQGNMLAQAPLLKDEIKPMDTASETILALKPVTFRYKQELDPEGIQQFGLVAEEVENVNPDLVACDDQGKPYTVRYEAVNAMLLNEFLKEHKKVAQLQAAVAQQQKDFQAAIAKLKETVAAQLNEQAAQIQKVGDQLEASKPAPQMVNNP
jgi:predicted ribosome quality control (RQC) complex YloA/Tae2 family protein